jgi:hypothetical protein
MDLGDTPAKVNGPRNIGRELPCRLRQKKEMHFESFFFVVVEKMHFES